VSELKYVEKDTDLDGLPLFKVSWIITEAIKKYGEDAILEVYLDNYYGLESAETRICYERPLTEEELLIKKKEVAAQLEWDRQ